MTSVPEIPATCWHLPLGALAEQDGIDAGQRPVLPLGHAVHGLVGDGGDGLLGHRGSVDLGQVRGDLPVCEPLGR